MKRVVFDHNIPSELRMYCANNQVTRRRKWVGRNFPTVSCSKLPKRRASKYCLQAIKGLRYQNNLAKYDIAVVVVSTNHWETIERNPDPIAEAIDLVERGGFREVLYPLPPRRTKRGPPV